MDDELYKHIETLILKYLVIIGILIAVFIIFILPLFESKTKQENAIYNQTQIERQIDETETTR